MLGFLRKKAQSPTLQATIVIIILVFIFWGVGNNQGTVKNTVATVNGENIVFTDYQKEYDRILGSIRDQFGGNLPSQLLDTLNIKDQVLNSLIQKALLRQGALESGLYVSDLELRNAIQNMDAFLNNGVFDVKWYEEVLAGSRLSVKKFEEGLRYDLLTAKVMDHLSRFDKVADGELQELFSYNYGLNKFNYAVFQTSDFADQVEITDEGLAAFYEANKAAYLTDPQVKLNYLLFAAEDQNLAAASDEEISQYYQNNLEQFSTPEKRRARHILIRVSDQDSAEAKEAARKKITEIQAELQSGAEFAELAKKYSEDGSAVQGGDLGFFSKGQMVQPFEEAVFALSTGETSGIITTQFGLHLIKLDAIEAANTKSLAEVKERIAATLRNEGGKTSAFQAANNAYEQIIMAGSLEKYATELAAKSEDQSSPLQQTEFFSQQAPPAELQSLPALVNAAFTLKKGELSSLVETSQGYAIVFVEDVKAPAQKELAEVREEVTAAYKAQQAKDLAKAAAASLLAQLQEGATFEAATQAAGVSAETTPFISRADTSAATLPAEIVENSFNLSEQKLLPDEVAAYGDSFYVVAFHGSQLPDPTLFDQKKKELEDQLKATRGNDLLTAWLDHLQKDAKITTNKELL